MSKISRIASGRSDLFPLFRLFAGFTNHRMTCSEFGLKAFRPSGRFSPWLRWSCWCAQLSQKGGHGPSHLRQRQNAAARLPRSVATLDQRTGQHQEIVSTGNHLGPAFGALRGTQPWDIPEQFLLVKAIAMLVRVAQAIGWTDLSQRSTFVAFPDKPTDLGIASLADFPRGG
jgi:hypothetical protein